MLKRIFGDKYSSATKREIMKKLERTSFSSFLPWAYHDEISDTYVNMDDTQGFVWECRPLVFAGDSTAQILEGLFRLNLPTGSILQFMLYADNHIDPVLERYQTLRTRKSDIGTESTAKFVEYLQEGKKGLTNTAGIPVRQFRLFVSLKFPGAKVTGQSDIRSSVTEILKGAHLQPELMEPDDLIDMLRRLFNGRVSLNNRDYLHDMPINQQIIFSDTEIIKENKRLIVGDKIFRCATVKKFPKEVSFLQTNEIFGGISGLISNSSQMITPFICTVNIVFDERLKAKLHGKCNVLLTQHAFGSFAPSLSRKKEEFLEATDKIERGTPFVRIMPILWVWADDDEVSYESLTRACRIWEAHDYVMQHDLWILDSLFVAALPFGLYNLDNGKTIDRLCRDVPAPSDAATLLLPVQSDFTGGGEPVLLFTGRKGQIITLDLFAKGAINYNMFVAASPGAGKSFFVNYLVSNYFASGARIRIVDVGRSYQKMTRLYGARFLDFDERSNICLNPFTNLGRARLDGDDRSEYLNNIFAQITATVMQMCYSATNSIPPDTEQNASSLIKQAVTWAWENYGDEACIDRVYDYLMDFETHGGEFSEVEGLSLLAKTLAFNLLQFTSGHAYGRWFNGKSTFDISNDEFVVLELVDLRPKPELFKVVTLQVINAITHDMYLSPRDIKKLNVFDEVWQFMREGTQLKDSIEAAYRMSRKHNGSITVVTQSILDMKQFGSVGDVINSCSPYKIFLESPDYPRARKEGLIDHDDFTLKLLASLKSMRPNYSELFIDSPFGRGVARLSVDPYSYYLYTSSGDEVAEIEKLIDGGMSYDAAIREMVRKYRSHADC